MPYLGIFGLEFKNGIVKFQISTLKFVQLQNFVKKLNFPNLGPKTPYLSIFRLQL